MKDVLQILPEGYRNGTINVLGTSDDIYDACAYSEHSSRSEGRRLIFSSMHFEW